MRTVSDLEQRLDALQKLLDHPDINSPELKPALVAALMPLVALANDDAIEVSAETFAGLSNKTRKLALASLVSVLIQTHDL